MPVRPSANQRLFRLLLALYPGEFRDEYGREVAMVFADRYRDAASARERALVWIEAITGVIKEAPKEHAHMLVQDLKYAFRTALTSPTFTATAVLTLALGIGATTAIFQLIDAVGLRPLPIRNPHELVELRIAGGNSGFGVNTNAYGQLTRPLWQEIRVQQQALHGAFAWSARDWRVGPRSDLRRVRGLLVSGDYFSVLGIQPWRGRLFGPGDDETACPETQAVVSYAYWQREMGGREIDRDTRILVNARMREVVGVTPPGFFGLAVGESFDVAMPFCREPLRRERFDTAVMGRLAPGWTIERASAHFDALSAGIMETTIPPGYSDRGIEQYRKFRLAAYSVESGVSSLRNNYDKPLKLLLVISGLVLLVACANLANLLLARAVAREREVSVRLALGASRIRILRQFLAESAVLAIVGAVAGIGLAQILSRALLGALSSSDAVPTLVLDPSWRVLTFTIAVAALTCVIFGIAPALRATHVRPVESMRAGGRGLSTDRSRLSVQRVMVVVQVAVSLVLLVAALLFVRSFRNLVTLDPGVRMAGMTVGFFAFDRPQGSAEEMNELRRALIADIQSIPGVLSAATTTNVPLLGNSWGHGVHVGPIEGGSRFSWVSPGYFRTMNVPIIEGRDFSWQDTRQGPRVAVVNQSFVRYFVPDGRAIGRILRTNAEPEFPSTEYEIVGVIPDTKYNDLRKSTEPMAFAPDSQFPPVLRGAGVMIHASIEPAAVIADVKRRIEATHPEIAGAEFIPFQQRIREGLLRERLLAMLAGFFSVLAALLVMIGLYGMIAFAVAQRRKEIGIRVALGAYRNQIVRMVMREAAILLLIGIAIGTTVSLLVGPSASALLFGLQPRDPATILAACAFLASVAGVGSFLPARAASKLDPLVALRQD